MVNPYFESPSVPHNTLENSEDLTALRTQVASLLALLRSETPNQVTGSIEFPGLQMTGSTARYHGGSRTVREGV